MAFGTFSYSGRQWEYHDETSHKLYIAPAERCMTEIICDCFCYICAESHTRPAGNCVLFCKLVDRKPRWVHAKCATKIFFEAGTTASALLHPAIAKDVGACILESLSEEPPAGSPPILRTLPWKYPPADAQVWDVIARSTVESTPQNAALDTAEPAPSSRAPSTKRALRVCSSEEVDPSPVEALPLTQTTRPRKHHATLTTLSQAQQRENELALVANEEADELRKLHEQLDNLAARIVKQQTKVDNVNADLVSARADVASLMSKLQWAEGGA